MTPMLKIRNDVVQRRLHPRYRLEPVANKGQWTAAGGQATNQAGQTPQTDQCPKGGNRNDTNPGYLGGNVLSCISF